MVTYFLTFASGVAAGVVLEKIYDKMNTSTVRGRTEALRAIFGEPMCTTILTLGEVKDWIKVREEKLENGAKAIVMKANNDTLKNLGKKINIDGVDNYLIIAIVTIEKNITDSVLIKYERLEEELEKLLVKGNGSLIVER